MNLTKEELMVVKKLCAQGGTGNVMEFLGYSSFQFDEGFRLANNLQNKDFIKLLYSNYSKNVIVAEATLLAYKTDKNI
jgi:hypothetical protein